MNHPFVSRLLGNDKELLGTFFVLRSENQTGPTAVKRLSVSCLPLGDPPGLRGFELLLVTIGSGDAPSGQAPLPRLDPQIQLWK